MPTLDVVVVDDEPVAVRRLSALLRGIGGVEVAGTAANASEAIAVAERCAPDLMLLDIEMPGLNGIELADRLRRLPEPPHIIFVTAFSRFAIEAFNVSATDYLLKPVEAPRLVEAIGRVREQRDGRLATERVADLEDLVRRLRQHERSTLPASDGEPLWLPTGHGRERVTAREITWIEAERDYVRIHAAGRSYFVRGRLGDLEKRLEGEGIVRVHRSAMVRAAAIRRVEVQGDRGYTLVLDDGTTVAASRRFGARVRALTTRPR